MHMARIRGDRKKVGRDGGRPEIPGDLGRVLFNGDGNGFCGSKCIPDPFSSVPLLPLRLLRNMLSTLLPWQVHFLSTPLRPMIAPPSSSHQTSVLYQSVVAALISWTTTTSDSTSSCHRQNHPVNSPSTTHFQVLPSVTMAASAVSSHCIPAPTLFAA